MKTKFFYSIDSETDKIYFPLLIPILQRFEVPYEIQCQYGWSNQPEVIVFNPKTEEILKQLFIHCPNGILIKNADWMSWRNMKTPTLKVICLEVKKEKTHWRTYFLCDTTNMLNDNYLVTFLYRRILDTKSETVLEFDTLEDHCYSENLEDFHFVSDIELPPLYYTHSEESYLYLLTTQYSNLRKNPVELGIELKNFTVSVEDKKDSDVYSFAYYKDAQEALKTAEVLLAGKGAKEERVCVKNNLTDEIIFHSL